MNIPTLHILLLIAAVTASSSVSAACRCPAGYKVVAGVSLGHTAAKVCKKTYFKKIKRKASCDIGFILQKDDIEKKDLCASIWGKRGHTIPHGTTGIIGHPSHFGWQLKVRTGRDFWRKHKKRTKIKACIG